jgi:hypothetical protein
VAIVVLLAALSVQGCDRREGPGQASTRPAGAPADAQPSSASADGAHGAPAPAPAAGASPSAPASATQTAGSSAHAPSSASAAAGERAALIGTGAPLGGEIQYLRRANAVGGWAAKRRAELEACAGGVSLASAFIVLEIATDGTVTSARLDGVEATVATASATCVRALAQQIRFVAAADGEGDLTLEVPIAGR